MLPYLIVCPMAFFAGIVDAIAGGGGLISFPAFVLAGLPVHTAIATNKMSSTTGTTIATIKYAINGFIPWKLTPFAIFAAFAGSAIGSNIALIISDHYFKILLLFLVPVIAYYVLKNKNFSNTTDELPLVKKTIFCSSIAFVVGIYDGFYGPGTGTFLILLLTAFAHMKLSTANGLTKVINLTTNIAALCVFLLNGKVLLPLGITAGIFNAAGNYIGATAFSHKGMNILRPIMILVLAVFLVKIVVDIAFG